MWRKEELLEQIDSIWIIRPFELDGSIIDEVQSRIDEGFLEESVVKGYMKLHVVRDSGDRKSRQTLVIPSDSAPNDGEAWFGKRRSFICHPACWLEEEVDLRWIMLLRRKALSIRAS